MRTSLNIISLLLLFHLSNAQTITIADLEKSLNKDKGIFIKIIETKGFKPGLQDLEKIAKSLALTVSEMTGKKFIGKSFMHSSNYTATIIYDEKGITHMVQFGTKTPKDDEVKKLATEFLNLDYEKTRDDESRDGRSNIRAYNKGDRVFSLASYYNGGYTLTGYLKVLEK